MRKLVLFFALVLALSSGSAFAAQLYYCGYGVPTNVAWDGSKPVLAYHNVNAGGTLGTFIWNPTTGSHQISTSGTVGGIAMKGSSVIVTGNGINGAASAKKWEGSASGAGSWSSLPLGAGSYNFSAYHVATTANNTYIAGSYNNGGTNYLCRYQESTNTTTSLALPSGYRNGSIGYSVSNSGTIVGSAVYGSGGQSNAVGGWNGSSLCGLDVLTGNPPSSTLKSLATGIALNDSRIAGWCESSVGVRKPVYWNGPVTSSGVNPVQIPLLPGHDYGTSTAISADGSIIGGYSYLSTNNPNSRTCWIWDAVHGTRDLKTILSAYGVDSTTWQFLYIEGFADGGRTLSGYGFRNGVQGTAYEAWVVTLPEPSGILSLSVLGLGLLPFIRRRRG